MAYKILALDIDGTLTNSYKMISESTKDALLNMQEKGIKVVLASGRSPYGISPLAKELELKKYGGYILAFNGAFILECRTNHIVYKKMLPDDAPQLFYRLASENSCTILSYENDLIITQDPQNLYVQKESTNNKMKIKKVDSFVDYITFPVPKCLIVQEENHLAKAEPIISAAAKGQYNIYRSDPYFLEIMPKDIDKAYSLKKLAAYLHTDREEIAACGDSYNDITMLSYAGLGVAMKNAPDSVKQKADYITFSNDEDGIVHVVDKIMNA